MVAWCVCAGEIHERFLREQRIKDQLMVETTALNEKVMRERASRPDYSIFSHWFLIRVVF